MTWSKESHFCHNVMKGMHGPWFLKGLVLYHPRTKLKVSITVLFQRSNISIWCKVRSQWSWSSEPTMDCQRQKCIRSLTLNDWAELKLENQGSQESYKTNQSGVNKRGLDKFGKCGLVSLMIFTSSCRMSIKVSQRKPFQETPWVICMFYNCLLSYDPNAVQVGF